MSEPVQTPEEIHQTLFDGKMVKVAYQSGAKAGTVGFVKVKKVSRAHFVAYAEAVVSGDELAECAFYGEPMPWPEELTDDSFDLVLEEGQKLNFPHLNAWLARHERRLGVLEQQTGLIRRTAHLIEKNPALKK